jgi:hypothetical protein
LTALLYVLALPANAQDLPSAQVWLARIANGIPTEPLRISPEKGYHNQPMFSPDNLFVYFTSEQADGQTDIARYRIEDGELDLVIQSPESEYSPTPIPGRNAVSVIRVELPGQEQRLWSLPLDNGTPELLMPDVEPVGYHTWIDAGSVAVFMLGESFTLHRASIGPGPSEFLADNIGRTLRLNPLNGNVLFVDKNTSPWSIASINPQTRAKVSVISLFPGIEDFEADPTGRLWMGYKSKLYLSQPENRNWRLVADFRADGFNNITRLASSPDGQYLAIIDSP